MTTETLVIIIVATIVIMIIGYFLKRKYLRKK
jgi:uncharacterized protein YneF (UPF0154 family)